MRGYSLSLLLDAPSLLPCGVPLTSLARNQMPSVAFHPFTRRCHTVKVLGSSNEMATPPRLLDKFQKFTTCSSAPSSSSKTPRRRWQDIQSFRRPWLCFSVRKEREGVLLAFSFSFFWYLLKPPPRQNSRNDRATVSRTLLSLARLGRTLTEKRTHFSFLFPRKVKDGGTGGGGEEGSPPSRVPERERVTECEWVGSDGRRPPASSAPCATLSSPQPVLGQQEP